LRLLQIKHFWVETFSNKTFLGWDFFK
jgi:hypothetical protein